jgi:hypothetical protein
MEHNQCRSLSLRPHIAMLSSDCFLAATFGLPTSGSLVSIFQHEVMDKAVRDFLNAPSRSVLTGLHQ